MEPAPLAMLDSVSMDRPSAAVRRGGQHNRRDVAACGQTGTNPRTTREEYVDELTYLSVGCD